MYLVLLWSIEGPTFEGPFADKKSARKWLADYEPYDRPGLNGAPDAGIVVGPLPTVGGQRNLD